MIIFNFMVSENSLGGTEKVYIDYAKMLSAEGHKVINITSFNTTANKLFAPNYRVLFNRKNLHPIGHLTILLLALYYRPKLIICHETSALRLSSLARKWLKIPVMAIVHIYFYNSLKRSDYVGAISQDIKSYLIKNGIEQEKLFLVGNTTEITRQYDQQTLFGKKDIILGGMGRLVVEKGFHYLIDTISILRNQGYNARLILGGTGKELDNLTAQVKSLGLENAVKFMGWVENKQEFFDQIDIFCLPSDREPFGLVILEAMNYSKPVIAVSEGGPKDIIQNKVNGLLVSQSGESFAQAVQELIKTEGLAENLTSNARQTLETKYSPSVIGENLSNIINIIAKK